MAEKKKWDLTSPRSLQAAAEWLRVRADAQVVLVIRKGDWVVGADPALGPQEVRDAVRDVLPPLFDRMLRRGTKG
jgi:hypothetical protein